jgi:hypothetical protein
MRDIIVEIVQASHLFLSSQESDKYPVALGVIFASAVPHAAEMEHGRLL